MPVERAAVHRQTGSNDRHRDVPEQYLLAQDEADRGREIRQHLRAPLAHGTLDLVFGIASAAAFAKAMSYATLEPGEGAAHSFPMEVPQEFTRRLLALLASTGPSAA